MTPHLRTAAVLLLACAATALGGDRILNASYDVSRELYREYDAFFAAEWKREHGTEVQVDVSHGGSSKQARSVADGLQADVVTMNQETDVNLLVRAGLVNPEWRTKFPDNSSPYTSTIVFLVRKGNPHAIRDWPDLLKPGLGIIIPNPKTSGNGRYSYLAAWAWARTQPDGTDEAARVFLRELFRRVPVLETGGRAATTTFIERGIGDVLLTFESEVLQITRQFSADLFEMVTPSVSIIAEFPVAVVDQVADKRGTRAVAEEYLRKLWSEPGQQIIARQFLRPRNSSVAATHSGMFPELRLVSVDELFGGWSAAQGQHFDSGGIFDQITTSAVLDAAP
jgi:sulfate transport system substrate-binding protein